MADQILFTCLSCSIAFLSAEEQRLHYRSDHHRYNMKRRVAGLPPVSALVFNEKVLERRQETAVIISPKDFTCSTCNKVYITENAYKSHLSSKRHRENELKVNSRSAPDTIKPSEDQPVLKKADASVTLSQGTDEDEATQAIDQKIAAARTRLSTSDCLFCPSTSASLAENLTHMSLSHSFFVPDAEKIAVGNVCIFCNAKSREFRTLEAVRKHMADKSHCKIANSRKSKKASGEGSDQEWEDVGEDDIDADEIVDEAETDEESPPDNQITYGDTEYELVLPSGARIGHRSMKRYYAQSFRFTPHSDKDTDSGVALVRRLLADKNAALVPRRGGFGAFGMGTAVVKARNAGEARNAGRHVLEHRDQRRREEFKTKVAFKHNHQKHYRDPLLQ
ncbi:hypothetical protein F5887DRAFT_952087 [Amanita rubescens]|nr:hypothetical protein F5887DRAFT_952087 [Amanita rubescens]